MARVGSSLPLNIEYSSGIAMERGDDEGEDEVPAIRHLIISKLSFPFHRLPPGNTRVAYLWGLWELI